MVRNRSPLWFGARKTGPPGAVAAVATNSHLALAIGGILRSFARRYSFVEDTWRKAPARDSRSLLHDPRSTLDCHAAREHRCRDRAPIRSANYTLAAGGGGPTRSA